uniref:Secreted protein n=1 Tax=Hucho hucho TaxID=62062 RepID=A0A4W5MA73_9TELE
PIGTALAVILFALPPLSHAAPNSDESHGVFLGINHCQDHLDGTWHSLGSRWRNSGCWDFTCEMCCHFVGIKGCKYDVFKKNDRAVPCPYFGGGYN